MSMTSGSDPAAVACATASIPAAHVPRNSLRELCAAMPSPVAVAALGRRTDGLQVAVLRSGFSPGCRRSPLEPVSCRSIADLAANILLCAGRNRHGTHHAIYKAGLLTDRNPNAVALQVLLTVWAAGDFARTAFCSEKLKLRGPTAHDSGQACCDCRPTR